MISEVRQQKMFAIGEIISEHHGNVNSTKQSSSFSQKSSSSEQLDTIGTSTVTDAPLVVPFSPCSPRSTTAAQSSVLKERPLSLSVQGTTNDALDTQIQPNPPPRAFSTHTEHQPGGGIFSRKRGKPVELAKSKRLAVFEIKVSINP